MCAAPKGHKMWGNPIKPKSYSPEELWENACLYFEWVDANPWMMVEQSKQPQKLPTNYDKKLHGSIKNFLNQIVKLPHARPYTIEGLCIYLNISAKTFRNYSDVAGYETYFPICSHIKTVIDNQQFDGGMVGAFNANIVTRKLGLADKQELTGKDGEAIQVQQITGMVVK